MTEVLLVEDAAFFERVIRRQLTDQHGFNVVSATTCAEARELLQNPGFRPAAALVDLTLPDAPNGEIVDLTIAAGLPTIVFSGRFDDELRRTVLEKGVVDYVLKESPSSLSFLTTLVQRIVANRTIDALVIDDSRADLAVIEKRLKAYQLRVHVALSARQAMDMLDDIENLKLVILDHRMPNVDGFEVLKALRQRYGMHQVAVIGLSGQAGPETTARFLKSGANDFISKSSTPEEFMLRLSQNLDTLDRIELLSELAHRDPLTGLSNRRHLFADGEALYRRCRSAQKPVPVAALDIDRFKRVNDTHGHEVGDHLIRYLGQTLTDLLPENAFAARLGGDEFCVIMPACPMSEAVGLLDAVRGRLAQAPAADPLLRGLDQLTVSVGLSDGTEDSLQNALRVADTRLYDAKNNGRDRIIAR